MKVYEGKIRPQKANSNQEKADLRLERTLRSGRTDSKLERAELKLKWLI